ncbi:MAG: DUF1573 domain-containing protein [Bacteroidota bacterium]
MRKIKILIILMLIGGISNIMIAQGPKINFEKTTHTYGKIKEEGGLATYKFKFKNTGKQPVIITRVQSSCGCTTPEWTRSPVKPGAIGFVSTQFDPRNRPGSFNKHVLVYNTATKEPVKLIVKGEVIPKQKTLADLYRFQMGNIRMKTNHVAFAKLNNQQVKKQSVEIVNDSDKDITISFDPNRMPSHIKAEVVPNKLKAKQKGKFIITYDASKKNSWGYVIDRLNILINGTKPMRNRLSVSATIVEDFSKLSKSELANAPTMDFDNKEFNFGKLKQGQKVTHEFKFKNNGKRDLIIRKTKTSCGCTAVETKKVIKPGETSTIKAVFNSAHKSGKQNKSVTLITNIPGKDKNKRDLYKIILRVKGEVIVEKS